MGFSATVMRNDEIQQLTNSMRLGTHHGYLYTAAKSYSSTYKILSAFECRTDALVNIIYILCIGAYNNIFLGVFCREE